MLRFYDTKLSKIQSVVKIWQICMIRLDLMNLGTSSSILAYVIVITFLLLMAWTLRRKKKRNRVRHGLGEEFKFLDFYLVDYCSRPPPRKPAFGTFIMLGCDVDCVVNV